MPKSISRSATKSHDPYAQSGRHWLHAGVLSELSPFFAILLAWLLLFSGSQAVNALEIMGAGNADANTTVVVTDPGDNADANTADGVCDVDLTTPGLQCTVRAAIQQSNGTAGVDTITFNLAGAGVRTIAPLTILPTISDVVILDGTTQPGFAGTPLIELSGASCATSPCHGLWITAGGSTVKGLIVNRFANRGIFLDTGDGNTLTGNIIGADSAGTAAAGNNTGIYVTDSANNTIGGAASDLRNLISGNNIDGINLNGAGTTGNTILGNYIGVDVNGTADLGNLFSGVVILNGASNNTVGGAYAAGRNVISGNQQYGVGLNGTAANVTGNVIAGNYIGLDVTGEVDLGNTLDGVIILNASSNVVGSNTPGVGIYNIISANDQNGVLITGTLSSNNQVLFNTIGLNQAGDSPAGNSLSGVRIVDAPNNIVGGVWGATGNLISKNQEHGVYISGSGATGNLVKGNRIGTSLNGDAYLGNTNDGVLIESAANNTVGGAAGITLSGACSGECNLIAGLNRNGVVLRGGGATGNIVQSNIIGLNASGLSARRNALHGVLVDGAPGNTIGGATAAARNVISANGDTSSIGSGVFITGTTATGNTVVGNYIGLDTTGATGRGNYINGVHVERAGNTAITGNVIADNGGRGIIVAYPQSAGTIIQGNIIGLDATGTNDVGNAGYGVWLFDTTNITLGGTTAAARNVISGNDNHGVAVTNESTAITVQGNYIGLNAAGSAGLYPPGSIRKDGLYLDARVSGVTIGGTAAGARNVISGNGNGIFMDGADGNAVLGNFIGTDATGATGLSNSTGVWIEDGTNNIIGGTAAGSRNVISGGAHAVVVYGSGAANNQVLGNYIGLNAAGSAALVPGNGGTGIYINGGAHDNIIGGTTAAARNVISGYGAQGYGGGILVGSDISGVTRNNQIIGNYIGTDPAGVAAIANATGIEIFGAATQIGGTTGVTPGGACTGACNLISGNGIGIQVRRPGASGTIIEGNYVGTDVSGIMALGNSFGMRVVDTQGVLIGGTTPATRNLVAGNTNHGVWFLTRSTGPYAPRVRLLGNYIGLNTAGAALGNGQHGIYLQDAVPVTLGGTGAGEANVIANNGGDGISAITSAEADIFANAIYNNTGLGIDLNDDGVTANDAGDADMGPNGLQNFPVLTSAISGGGTTTIQGSLNSAVSSTFRLEFFSDASCDASGNGEGRTYLGAETVATDGGGNASFTASLAAAAVPGQVVVATATDPTGYTSEFSACVVVQAPPAACTPGPHSGTIAADETWCASDSPHTLNGDVVVAPGVTLTIEPGVVVKGSSNVELKVQGHLAAIGTAAQPITFTSTTDTAANQWSGLIFDGGTGDLNYATVRYGGNVNSINGNCSSSGLGFNIAVRNVLAGEVRLQNSQVLSERYLCNGWQNADYGLYIYSSHVTIDNTLFQSNGNASDDYPIYAFGASSVVTLTNSTFTANARQRVLFGAGVLSTWDASLAPQTGLEGYELAGDMTVPVGRTWTVQPGAVLMGRDHVEINVQGHLAAIGSPALPITFTSSTNTGTAQWSGLVFDGGTGDLRHATVRYGGDPNSINGNCNSSGLGFNIAVRNVQVGEVRLENSQVLSERFNCNNWQAEDYGLYVVNSHVVVSDTLFQANGNDGSDYPIYVQSASSTLALTGNTFTGNPRNRVLLGSGALTAANVQMEDEQGLESYEMEADYLVPVGITLTVDPGVMVMGRSNVELRTLGHLAAIGAPSQPITFTSSTNTGTAQWSGLVFDGGTGDLRHATVRYGGDPNSINGNCNSSGLGFNIAVRNVLAGEVRLQNSKVLSERFSCNSWQAEDYGLYVVNSHVVVSDTLFQANGNDGSDYPIYVQSASSTLALTGNTFTGNPRNRVLLAAGALTAINVHLEDETGLESYELEADYVVPVSITLTVDPGVVIMGRSNVELRTLGHLVAIGTPTQPITFTSATNTAANQWSGLVFDGGTGDLRHATVRYGGNVNSINANCNSAGMGFNVAVRNVLAGEVHLQNTQVLSERYLCNGWQTEDYGLYVDNSHVVVSDTLFQANGNDGNDYPIYVQGATSTLALIGNTFTANPRNRVLVIPGAMTAANFTLVAETGLESYELPADFTVPAGITMTLEPGVMVMGRSNVELRTLGHLAAIGAPTQPITFTSATNTAANQWSGLVFDGGTGNLQHATVRYGGNVNSINSNCSTSGMGFNVAVRNVSAGEVRLEHSKILSERYTCNNWTASDYGLYVNNSRMTVNNTLFANNGNSSNDYAVYATGASSVLTFDGNVLRNNVRGLLLNGVASQTLRNNAIIDNQQGGISIGSGANAQIHHATVARNGGDGVTVANGGSASLVNTILAENVTGLRVTTGGVATLSQTLWDNNGTNTVGAVNQTGSLAGLTAFDDDGYHLTRYSAAIEQGMDAGVLTDVDGEARPQPAGASPDLGADEYIYGYGEEFIFEKIALPLQWAVAPPPQGGLPSGSLIQRYLLRYYYGSPDPNAPALTVSVSDTLPAVLALQNEEHYPAMSFQQAGQTLSWQTLQPVARGQTGQIQLDTRYDNPQPGDVLTNTAALHTGSVSLSDVAVTQVPLFAPLIVAPDNGELCAGQVEIRGLAQPGMTVHLMIDNTSVLQVQTDASGEFVASYSYAGSATEALTAQACTAGGQCSPVSPAKTLRPPQSFWCPQRSSWEGTPTVGPKAGQHLVFNFRNNTGEFSSQNWRIPGVFGFWNTTLNLHACNCPPASGTTAAPTTVWLIADGVRYDPTGVYPNFTFAVTGTAHNVVFWAQCGANLISSSGRVLIDPDGYVFDVTQGFDPINPTLHAMTGVTVTAYVSSTELGGWAPWPAHLYNNQVNPQVTGSDGYFAFFTPPGFYYLQVDGKPGYQPWRSPVVEVVDQIVHVNVPYTPWTETFVGEMLPTEVLLTANGPQPADITVAPGSTVLWRSEVDGLATPAQLVQQTDNPALQPLSTLNPISNTLGWDGGMLAPGQTYRRQMETPGFYTYTDGLGHQGQICVTPCSPMAVSLATFDATSRADHILVAWETTSEIDNAGFNLYRSASDDRSSATLVTFVPSQAPGSGQGASYAYQDFDVTAGQTAWYWLEAIDLSGVATLHGPVSVTMQTPTAVKLSQFEANAPRSRAAPPITVVLLRLTVFMWAIYLAR